jgi:hypothetical protein
MARDYISIGCTPAGEDCVQVSSTEYYMDKMLAECNKYKEMLQAKFADCTKVTIAVKTFSHDFGSYAEVIVKYENTDNEALAQAIHIENNSPMNWNDTEPIKFEYDPEEYELD